MFVMRNVGRQWRPARWSETPVLLVVFEIALEQKHWTPTLEEARSATHRSVPQPSRSTPTMIASVTVDIMAVQGAGNAQTDANGCSYRSPLTQMVVSFTEEVEHRRPRS